jgi:RHS repeat-associated protein
MATSKGFTGQYNDSLTGLDYYGSRYYDPTAGVFLSADPVQGDLAGTNPYEYVGSNPETNTDPSGQMYTPPPQGGGSALPPVEPRGGWGNWGSGSGTSNLPPSSCGDTVQSGCLLGRLAAQTDWQGQARLFFHVGLSNGGGLFCHAASSGVAVSVGFGGFATLSMSRTGSGCFSSGNGDVTTTTTTTVQGSSVTPVDTCFSMQCISEGAQGAADKPTDGEEVGAGSGGEELAALMDGEGDGGGGGKEPSIGDNSGDSSTTTAYRVQGGGSKERITVTPEGNIQIKGKDMLYVNFGNYDRALEFLGKRSEDAYIVQFEVSNELVDVIRSEAKLQYRGVGREFPANPQLVDPKYPGQYGLPQEYFDLLIEFTIPGSAKLITF